MKIAGTRNAGAWYRMNNYLKSDTVDAASKTALGVVIKNLDTLAPYLAALAAIASEVGLVLPDTLSSADAFSTHLVTVGVPENVWLGTLAFDTYTVNDLGKYKPDSAAAARKFGSDLRKVMTQWKFSNRMMIDLANTRARTDGNPGGIADANKQT